jgi:ABC-type proline/glycine betaine transport system permease subunit
MAAFMSSFVTYLLIFVVSIICVTIAVKLGIAWRKSSDSKKADAVVSGATETSEK